MKKKWWKVIFTHQGRCIITGAKARTKRGAIRQALKEWNLKKDGLESIEAKPDAFANFMEEDW